MWTVFWRTVFCNVFVVTNRTPRELMGDMGLCTLTRDSHHNSSASSTLVAVGAFHDVFLCLCCFKQVFESSFFLSNGQIQPPEEVGLLRGRGVKF